MRCFSAKNMIIKAGDCVGYVDFGYHYGTVVKTLRRKGEIVHRLSVRDSGLPDDCHYKIVKAKKCWKVSK